ncbi:hypothetical protein [Streptomyces sp. NPDC020965]|uniref:hypothetical protein n=1 Tax=Streptomyces sp. NPDC020965 TaxID=3365105 RepID=UPI0037A7B6E8
MTRSKRMLPYALVRTAAVFALSAGVAAPVLITAPVASAAVQNPIWMRPATLADGRLDLYGLTSDPLWVSVSVMESTAPDAAVLMSTNDLTYYEEQVSEEADIGWRTDAPVQLPVGTPLGEYPIVVSYRLSGEPVQRWTGGNYRHQQRTGVTSLSYDREHTDYDNRSVTVSGAVTTYNPSTRTRTPAREGIKVQLYMLLGSKPYGRLYENAVTGPGGKFSLPITPHNAISGGWATLPEPGDDLSPTYTVPKLSIAKFPYRISAEYLKTPLPNGEVEVKGRLERLTNDGWRPYKGATVVTSNEGPYHYNWKDASVGSGTVAADGSFSYRTKPKAKDTWAQTYPAPSAFYSTRPFVSGSLTTPKPTVFKDVRITLDQYRKVKAVGRVEYRDGNCPGVSLELQHSTDGKTWRKLAGKWNNMSCDFQVTADRVYNSAHYRVRHAEDSATLENASPAVRQSRNPTRFSGDTITPVRPAKNGTITSTGTFQRYVNDRWQSYPGGKITLVFQAKGETRWQTVTKGTAGSGGTYTLKGKPTRDGNWAVRADLTAGHFYSETKVTYVDAR